MDVPHDGGVALFEIRCWLCYVRGQEVRNYSIMLEIKFGGGMAMFLILAQMFCLRNGVRTKREKRGTRGRSFRTVLCVRFSGQAKPSPSNQKSLSDSVTESVSDSWAT